MTVPVWDEERVQRWLGKVDALEAQLVPVSDVLFAAAKLGPGLDVLDVGCGPGSTTQRAYDLVAPSGTVTGLDVAPSMIEAGRRLAGDRSIRWLVADVVEQPLSAAAYDVVISRFGVMFFTDPALAFRRLAEATRSGGRLCLAVWRSRGDTPLFDVPFDAVTRALRAVGLPFEEPPAEVGPSSLGDPHRAVTLLRDAGWSDVTFEPQDQPLYVNGPGPLDEVVTAALDLGPLRVVLEGQPPDVIDLARSALQAELAPLHDGTGVSLPGGFAIIRASRT